MRLTALAAFILSTSAFAACPNLTGKYAVCRSTTGATGGMTDLVVAQSVRNKITIYNVTSTDEVGERASETYKTDGKTVRQDVTDADSGMTLTTLTTSSCVGNALSIKTEMLFMGERAGWANLKVYKNGTQLIVETQGNDGEENYTDKEICE